MVFEGGFIFENIVIFDPIDRIWIFWGLFQPSVHSETASSAIFYLWVWKMTVCILENPGILSTPGWLYMYIHYIHIHKYTYTYTDSYTRTCTYSYIYTVRKQPQKLPAAWKEGRQLQRTSDKESSASSAQTCGYGIPLKLILCSTKHSQRSLIDPVLN